jgi:hypothetical protein
MKVGSQVIISGEIRLNGVLQDISTWTIRSDARKDSETGAVVASAVVTKPSLGLYTLTFETSGLAVETIFTDTRIIDASGQAMITPTISINLSPAITA